MIKRLLFLALATACSPDKTDDAGDTGESTTASTATDATAGSTTDDAPTAGSTDVEPTGGDTTTGDSADFDALGACAVDMVCEQFLHDDGEEQGHGDQPPGYLDVERCILTGLRDSTPGRYIYGVTTYTAAGNGTFRVQFIVHADRTVTFARHSVSDNFNPDDPDSGVDPKYTPAQTCEIADAAFFDDCLTNHDDASHYPGCMKIETWWTDCVASEPRCE